jgi:WD40 repeat protein
METGRQDKIFEGHRESVRYACVSPDGRYMASADTSDTVILWSLAEGIMLKSFKGSMKYIRAISFSPDSKFLAVGNSNKITQWDVQSGKLIQNVEVKNAWISSLNFSVNGKYIAAGGGKAMINIFDSRTGNVEALIMIFENQWVCITSEGYYTSSSGGGYYVYVEKDEKIYRLEEFDTLLKRPDMVQDKLEAMR